MYVIDLCMQNMRNKDTSIGGFADYARNVNKYKKGQRSYQERVEYIKALFEVRLAVVSSTSRRSLRYG